VGEPHEGMAPSKAVAIVRMKMELIERFRLGWANRTLAHLSSSATIIRFSAIVL
jgi:hypothetical protein